MGRYVTLKIIKKIEMLHFLLPLSLVILVMAARHHSDLIMCRKQPGISQGLLCIRCDGRCPICDSQVNQTTIVRICDECSFGHSSQKCIICGSFGSTKAYYCYQCTVQEKDRDGCPRVVNLGSAKVDRLYEKKRYD